MADVYVNKIFVGLENTNKASVERLTIILQAIADGLTYADAAKLAGVDQDTITNWKKISSEFSEEIEKMEIQFKREQVDTIRKASKRNWTASAWLLERKFPEWQMKQKVEHSGDAKFMIVRGEENKPSSGHYEPPTNKSE